jgi:hypothetical protein
MAIEKTISGALESIAQALKALAEANLGSGKPSGGGGYAPHPSGGSSVPYKAGATHNLFELAVAEGPYEEVRMCRSLGTAKVHIRGEDLYIVPDGKLHKLTGEEDGTYVGVFKASVKDDLLTFPPDPSEPFDEPSDIPDFRANLKVTKAIWKFAEGNIRAVGPANSYVIPLRDGSNQLVISIAMVITGGTGRYQGARGTVSSLGATWFPYIPGVELQDALKDGALFEAKGVHGFRITLKDYQRADGC